MRSLLSVGKLSLRGGGELEFTRRGGRARACSTAILAVGPTGILPVEEYFVEHKGEHREARPSTSQITLRNQILFL